MLPGNRRHRGTRIHFGRCSPLIFSILVQLCPNMPLRGRIIEKYEELKRTITLRGMVSIVIVSPIERYSSKYKE